MKHLAILTLHFSLLTLHSSASVPQRWTVDTSRAQPATFEAYQGETLTFEAALQSAGKPLELSGIAALYWQTNGMGSAYWETTAAVNSNRLSAVWTPEMDVGARVYNCFIGIPGKVYRAAFQLRLRPSPGAEPNTLPLPVPVIDFAKVRVLNPPWGSGGGGVDTNAVRDIIRDEITPATNRLNQTLSDALGDKRDLVDLNVYGYYVTEFGEGSTGGVEGFAILANDGYWYFDKLESATFGFLRFKFEDGKCRFENKLDRGGEFSLLGIVDASPNDRKILIPNSGDACVLLRTQSKLAAVATDDAAKPANGDLVKYDAANDRFVKAAAGTDYVKDISGKMDKVNSASHGFLVADENGNAKPSSLVDEITIGEMQLSLQNKADRATTLSGYGITDAAPLSMISETDQTFSNAVLAVGLNIDTNSVAVLNEIASTFGGFPIKVTATTVGGLLAALAAAVAWLKKNKVQTLKLEDGSVVKTAENGVAKLDDFFTESNSLLTGTIDVRLPYPLNAVTDETGLLKDRAINTTSLASVTVPDNFTDLLVRASVASSLAVTMPNAITKYGDTFPGEAGEYLITITKTGAAEAYVRTIKLEEVA